MSTFDTTRSPKRLALYAGLLYLVIITCGVVGQAFIREPIFGSDAAETTANLLAAELPFRLSILGDAAMVLADVGIGILLFVLFVPVDRTLSLVAMAFRLAQAAVLGANLLHLDRALAWAHTTGLDPTQRDALVSNALEAHAVGYDLGLFFFAVNCLLVGILIIRHRNMPSLIGVGIIASGVVYLAGSITRFVAPGLAEALAPAYGIPLIAELALCAWLLVAGLRKSGPLAAGARPPLNTYRPSSATALSPVEQA